MGKKKVLFVVNSLNIGGAEKSLISLLTAIDYSEYEVELQMFSTAGAFIKLVPEQVRLLEQPVYFKNIQQPLWKLAGGAPAFFARLRVSFALRRNIDLHDAQIFWKYSHHMITADPVQYDVAIAWGQGNPTHYVAEKVTAAKKIAFINADYEAVGHNKEFDRPYYMAYDHIACVSDVLTEKLKLVFPEYRDRIKTIYDINNAELIVRMAEMENPFANDRAEVAIVTVGRLVKPKGYDIAVDACNELMKAGVDFHWYFVGEGPERESIEHQIESLGLKEKVRLVGAKENPYVYMKHADVYVQTSYSEGYCLTLGEARILNIPVVATDFETAYAQIDNGRTGMIVAKRGEDVATAIIKLLQDDYLRTRIIGNLSMEKKGNVEEIEKLYQLIGA